MSLRATTTVVLACALAALPCLAQSKKKLGPIAPAVADSLMVEVTGVELVPPKEPCRNWQWAAVAETILRHAGVRIAQSVWIEQADGNACLDDETAISREHIAKALSGVNVLDDGRRVRVRASAPAAVLPSGAILPTLRGGRPMLLIGRDATYLLEGVVFDVLLYPAGLKKFIGRELWVVDAATGERKKLPVEEAAATLVGVVDIVAEPMRAGEQ